jgi:hypothetical protein
MSRKRQIGARCNRGISVFLRVIDAASSSGCVLDATKGSGFAGRAPACSGGNRCAEQALVIRAHGAASACMRRDRPVTANAGPSFQRKK